MRWLRKLRPLSSRLAAVRLVASDLDGTLLTDANVVHPAVRAAIAELRERDIEVMLASGRTEGFVRRFAAEIGSTAPIVSLNGSLIREADGSVVFAAHMSHELGRLVHGIVNAAAMSSLAVFTSDGVIATVLPPRIPAYLRAHAAEHHATETLEAYFDSAVMHVVCAPFAVAQEVRVRVQSRFGRAVEVVLYAGQKDAAMYYVELRRSRVDKGTALAEVASLLGLRPRQIAAIGDYSNDVVMCRSAGVSAAMLNAITPLKDVVDFVTRNANNDGGAAEFFRAIARART